MEDHSWVSSPDHTLSWGKVVWWQLTHLGLSHMWSFSYFLCLSIPTGVLTRDNITTQELGFCSFPQSCLLLENMNTQHKNKANIHLKHFFAFALDSSSPEYFSFPVITLTFAVSLTLLCIRLPPLHSFPLCYTYTFTNFFLWVIQYTLLVTHYLIFSSNINDNIELDKWWLQPRGDE